MHRTSLEQWLVLQTVVDAGGFAQAAELLHRSQSSVSYAVARLQERLGVELLHIDGRRAHLTTIGETLLQDARLLITELETLELRAHALAQGAEAKVRLAVDSIYPKDHLFGVLARFAQRYPYTRVELNEVIRLSPSRGANLADLSICLQSAENTAGQKLMDVELIAVAHRDHPLHHTGKTVLSFADLTHHLQVRLGDESLPAHELSGAPRPNWMVNTVEAAIEAVRSRLCFGWLPRHTIQQALADGLLLPLPLGTGQTRDIPLTLHFSDYDRTGSTTRALASLLLETDSMHSQI
jgi:DNA-binding transcriptional LysR family regulator